MLIINESHEGYFTSPKKKSLIYSLIPYGDDFP